MLDIDGDGWCLYVSLRNFSSSLGFLPVRVNDLRVCHVAFVNFADLIDRT